MVWKNSSKLGVACSYGLAMSALFVEPDVGYAEVLDLTYNGGANSMVVPSGVPGTFGYPYVMGIDQIGPPPSSGSNVEFCVHNTFAIATAQPIILRFIAKNDVLVATFLSEGQSISPYGFAGNQSLSFSQSTSTTSGNTYLLPIPEYVGFQTISGGVGWYKIDINFFNDLVISDGQIGTEGETLFAGGEPLLMGDINCDGAVNLLDVGPFIALLNSGGYLDKADFDQNGAVNLLDVGPFIDALNGG